MATPVNRALDFLNANRIINLAPATVAGQPVTYEQLIAALEGMDWKEAVRVRAPVNITIASPGASIDGVTMAANDRVVLANQTAGAENGIYIWNGAAVPMTRALDASTWDELVGATVNVLAGTSAATTWRQTATTGTLGTTPIVWASFGTAAPAASETTAGIAEFATQAEVDAGTDTTRTVRPITLANYSGRAKRYAANIGDASATSIVVTHNLGTTDVCVDVWEVGGSKRQVIVEVQATSTNSVTVIFDTAPALNSHRVVVVA